MQEESEIVRFRALTISTEGREMLQKSNITLIANCKCQKGRTFEIGVCDLETRGVKGPSILFYFPRFHFQKPIAFHTLQFSDLLP